MSNSIAKKQTVSSLLRFALPTIIMMVFMSLYTIVDGFFVSRYVGANALSSINIVYPIISVLLGVGIMLATGSNAIIGKYMGQGDPQKARQVFTFVVCVAFFLGVVFLLCLNLFITPLVNALGASEVLRQDCITYLRTSLFFAPALLLQLLFQTFFVTEGKPHIGLFLTIGSGITNMVLDYIFIVPLNMGINGAALATGIGFLIPSVFGILYFFKAKNSLYFVPFRFNGSVLKESCLNGSSEMVTQISTGVITIFFNMLMLKYVGESGVAAITIIQYSEYLLNALFMGFSMGIAPIISFNYGQQNLLQLKRLTVIALRFCFICSGILCLLAKLSAPLLIQLFTKQGSDVYELALSGFLIFSTGFLFSGTNIFSSALFTALSDGKTSAIISFSRTFLFIIVSLITLPRFFGVDGIFMAIPVAETFTLLVTFFFLKTKGPSSKTA